MAEWRRTRDYRQWRVAVIRRDKRCVICHALERREAHHIKDGSHHPESRYDIENGVTLCRPCHTALHCDFKRSFREKCTEKDWYNFLALVLYIKNVERQRILNEITTICS